MAQVFIPAAWRDLTQGVLEVRVDGTTLAQIVDQLEARFPGIAKRWCEDGEIAAGLAVSIDGAITNRGLRTPVGPDAEVHVLPAIGGG